MEYKKSIRDVIGGILLAIYVTYSVIGKSSEKPINKSHLENLTNDTIVNPKNICDSLNYNFDTISIRH